MNKESKLLIDKPWIKRITKNAFMLGYACAVPCLLLAFWFPLAAKLLPWFVLSPLIMFLSVYALDFWRLSLTYFFKRGRK